MSKSKHYALEATKRDRAGKGVARALRRESKIPAVIYGDKKEPVKITLPANAANVEYNRGHMYTTLCDLNLEGEKHLLLARDVQLHPVTDVVEHIDFLRVSAKTQIAVFVPVHFINEDKSPGIYKKAILNVVRHEVELMCSATDIPELLEVDLEGKETGDTVKVSDAMLPKGTTPVISDRNFTIATLVAPKTAEQEAAEDAEGAEGAEMPAEAEGAEATEEAEGQEKAE